MSSFLRQFYFLCIQADYERWRYHKAILNILQDVPKVDNLLDTGCGEDTKTIQYAKMLSVSLERFYGIEIEPKHVKIAKEHL